MTDAVENGRSNEVDSLRAFAMLAVLALHTHLLPSGWMGVWLFYVISGYVVTLSVIGRAGDEAPMARLSGFLQRRAARILPVYYLYIGIGLIVALVAGLPQDATSIASLVLFFDNATMVVGGGRIDGWPTGHLWTLSTEMQFYALYGVALCLLPRRQTRALLLALLLACPIVRLIVGQWLAAEGWRPQDAAFAVYAGPGLHFDIFAMGCLLAFAQVSEPGKRLSPLLLPAGLAAVTLYFAIYAGINLIVRHEHGVAVIKNVLSGILFGELREVFLYSAVGLFMTGLVAFAAEGPGRHGFAGLGGGLLRLPALQWVGRISYGGYLFHPLGLKVSGALLAPVGIHVQHAGMAVHLVQFAIALPLTLLVAWLSWRFFETPLRRWSVGGRKAWTTAPASPQPRFELGAP
jgi:peptidoglycan/LPS O-acetylase OafA/YrhL